jgi:CMP-2-keto-3-deoxyoctulosonic acid synthetase
MLEQLRALHLGARIAVIRTGPLGVGVDTPADAGLLEDELRRRGMA